MTIINSSVSEKFKTLKELDDLKAHQRLPTVVFLSILIAVGIIGNIVVLVAYSHKYRPSTFRTFILTLAVVDLSSCLIGMPMELVDNLYPLTFYNETFCKIGKFLGQILKIASALIVLLMAVVRYQKICRPFSTIFSIKVARNLCILSIFVAALLSWPFLILQGTQFKQYDGGVVGHDCSVDSDVKDTIYPFVYTIITFAVYMFVFFGLLILYTLIILNLHRHSDLLNEQKHRTDPRITKIMIAITVAFVVTYLPDCILDANSTFNKGNTLPPTPIVVGSLPLLARAYFINNVINPIIYFVGDTKFRKILIEACMWVFHFVRGKEVQSPNFQLSDTLKTDNHSNSVTKNNTTATDANPSSTDKGEL